MTDYPYHCFWLGGFVSTELSNYIGLPTNPASSHYVTKLLVPLILRGHRDLLCPFLMWTWPLEIRTKWVN